ncbi:YidC/Oxa1 family membrane protein insertase [soil metagenome]
MSLFNSGPLASLLDLLYSVVVALGDALAPFLGPFLGGGASAAAIVVLTMAVRTALIPLAVRQVRAELTRRRLAPLLAELNRKHAKNPERLRTELAALYARESASPFAGILPALAQAPVISLIYALFVHPSIDGHANALLTDTLFGIPLGHTIFSGFSLEHALVFGGILLVLAAIAQASRVVARRYEAGQPTSVTAPAAGPGSLAPSAGLVRALSFAPFISVVFAAFAPLAAAIYLTVSTGWTLVERSVLRRRLA